MTAIASPYLPWDSRLADPIGEESDGVVTNLLYDRLRPGFDAKLFIALSKAQETSIIQTVDQARSVPREYKRAVLTYGAAFLPAELLECCGVSAANPPQNIHSMVRE